MSMNGLDATSVIARFLKSLPHIGRSGFEGLVAHLCEAATGQRFRLSGAGSQFGQDARAETGYGNNVKVETKHYKKTSLDSRELAGELLQAATADPHLELWVLAASCAVRDQHAEQLESSAKQLGVEVVILDVGNRWLPRMAVLMAAFPTALENWIDEFAHNERVPELGAALAEIASDNAFESARAQLLQKLRGTLLGYDDARNRIHRKFLDTIKDVGNATAVLNQQAAVRAKGAQFISRTGISDALVTWWKESQSARPRAVLLGEEGTGKTWAVFAWLAERVEAESLPIVLPFAVAAEAISNGDNITTVIPKLLWKWSGLRDATFWERRLKKWVTSPELSRILLLIVADGLNERPSVNWPSFFAAADDQQWRNRIAILATDRPLHWRPNCATAGLEDFRELPISGYTDSELNEALEGEGINIEEIPQELQKLIRTPKYCGLVTTHFQEMKREGDFTIERLIWLDAQTRAKKKRGALSEAAFVEIIRNLAKQYRQSDPLTLSTIQSLLPFPDPERRIHQEIIDGGLLVQEPGASSKYIVEHSRLVFGLGMLLADEIADAVENCMDGIGVQDHISSWFEPHPEMELKVEICGAALFHSLIGADYPTQARRHLFSYWLRLRNWHDRAQAAFVDYVVRCPEDFIAAAEDVWSADRDLGAAQEFLARAFIRHRDDDRVSPTLHNAVARWMGFVHPAGQPIFRRKIEKIPVLRQKVEDRVGIPLQPGPVEICGQQLTVIENDGLLRLKRLAFLIMSSSTRKPFLDSLSKWAVASAVMGHEVDSDVAAWVIRMSDERIDSTVISEGEHLLGRAESFARTAGRRLIGLCDPIRAEELFETYPDEYYENWKRETDRHASDPCVSFYKWSDDECTGCLDRTDVPVLQLLGRIQQHLHDPGFQIPDSLVHRTCDVLRFDPRTFRTGLWATAETHALDLCIPLLASRNPTALSDFVNHVVSTLPTRTGMELYALAVWLPEFASLIRPDQMDLLLACLNRIAPKNNEAHQPTDAFDENVSEAFLVLSIAAKIPTDKFFSLILSRSSSAVDLVRFQPWLRGLSTAGSSQAKEILMGASDDCKKIRALWFLAFNDVELEQAERQYVAQLVSSTSPVLTGAVLRFACLANDDVLGSLLVNSDFSFSTDGNFLDSIWGPQLFVTFAARVPFEVIVHRLHPADASFALANRSASPGEISTYASLLDSCIRQIMTVSDPNVKRLPKVVGNPGEDMPGRFPTFEPQQKTQVVLKSPDSTWGSVNYETQNESLHDVFDTDKFIEKQNRLSRERVQDVFAAWATTAYNWFGRSFSSEALSLVYNHHPDLVNAWVENICTSSTTFRRAQVRLGSFLSQLCGVLLFHSPALGCKLWKMLRQNDANPIVFDSMLAALRAADCDAVSQARWIALGDCWDDAALARFAYLAEAFERKMWLSTAIRELVCDAVWWKRAKGLTIASFSNLSAEEFENTAMLANIKGTWVEPQIPILRNNVLRNQWAQHWYKLFLDADVEERSWGAGKMLLLSGDDRFFTWRCKYERDGDHRRDRRLRFLESQFDVNRELDREKERKQTLFGIKTEPGEVYPFMNR